MKTLYIMRHAKSSWDVPGQDDFDRPLNNRGEKDAPRMGKRLMEKKVKLDVIYSSPAVRARATAKIVAKILDYKVSEIQNEKKMFHAGEESLLNIVKQAPEFADSIMIIGHNPGLTDFVNELLNEEIENISTAGVVAIQMKIKSWKEADWKCGQLLFYDYPKLKH